MKHSPQTIEKLRRSWTPERKAIFHEKMSGAKHPMYGKTHTPETRLKISQTGKGRTPWNKGIKMNIEFREKCRQRQLGKKMSPTTIAKIKLAISGSNNYLWKGGYEHKLLLNNHCFNKRPHYAHNSRRH